MRILVLMCFFCILTTNINSADWPHWRGPNQNGTSSEIDLIDQWEEGSFALLERTRSLDDTDTEETSALSRISEITSQI